MKIFALALLTGITAVSITANAQRVRTCSDQSRLLDDVLRRSSTASQRLSQNLYDLNRLTQTLESGAQIVGQNTTIDIRRELEGAVSDVERNIRSSQSSVHAALADLRDTVNHGSHAYTLARMAADKLVGAKQSAQSAERAIDTLKTRIDQVQQAVNGNPQAAQLKRELQAGFQALQEFDRAFAGLSELSRISNLGRDYVTYCSNAAEQTCGTIRTNLVRSTDRLTDDGREVESAAIELRRLRYSGNQILSGLSTNTVQYDLHGILHGVIHSQSLPYLQDSFNHQSVAEQKSREASTASSGVLHAQLVRESISLLENGDRLLNQSQGGLNQLRNTINDLAIKINSGSQTTVTPFQLRQASQEVSLFGRRVDIVVRRLGTNGWSSGNLGEASRNLEDHRRYCELP